MNKRPITVTVIGWLLLAVGAVGFAYHFVQIKPENALRGGNIWIFVVEIVALVCGIFLLRGKGWARWLALAWIAFHVAFSFLNSWGRGAIHGVIFLLFAYFLFRPEAQTYFRQR